MNTSTSSGSSRQLVDRDESPFRRDNHWGESDDDFEQGGVADRVRRTNSCPDPNDPAKWIAHEYLAADSQLLCATTLFDEPYNGGRTAELIAWLEADASPSELAEANDPDELIDGRAHALHHDQAEVPLSAPEMRLPRSSDPDSPEHGQIPNDLRVNEETGYISGGETTAVAIQDRPLEEFMATVDRYIATIRQRLEEDNDFGPRVQEALDDARDLGLRLKRNGDHRDRDIMEAVVREVRSTT